MNTQYPKIIATALALFFLSGCAVFVRDDDWHHYHHGYWHYSSLQQSDQSPVQVAAQYNSGGSGPVSR